MYKRSRALITFYNREREVLALLKIVREKQKDFKTAHQSIPVIRACVVLLYGHLEGYIEDVIVETVEFFNTSAISANTLPIRLLIANCNKDISEISQTTDLNKKKTLLRNLIMNNYPLWNNEKMPPAKLETECFVRDFANPSVEHIDKLFKQFGVDKPFAGFMELGFSKRRVGQIISTLERLSALRHDIAHGSFSSSCTYNDLISYSRTINILSRCIDAKLGLVAKDVTGLFPWVC